ncbi:hypothetical protein GA0074695_4795 [Micromonospora viridifaciens]|uniref:Transposase n=1 Tax=Micromonospora viridifaciens TaxID=1881 RepID=A0A1C4YWQ1_MICVI|nr:hypothetical protein GA0074695_4795 [Micromonospora viridifaciens]
MSVVGLAAGSGSCSLGYRDHGLMAVGRKSSVATGLAGAFLRRGCTRQDPHATPAPDLVDRQFTAAGPNRLWVANATRMPCGEGVFWLAAVCDAFSLRIVGWKTSNRCDTDLIRQRSGGRPRPLGERGLGDGRCTGHWHLLVHRDHIAGCQTPPAFRAQRCETNSTALAGIEVRLVLDPDPRDVQIRVAHGCHVPDVPQRSKAPIAS